MHVERHKTALHRQELSKPVRLALNDKLIEEGARVFDYGCGRGGDVRRLRELGFACDGWDPVYASGVEKTPADMVNLGYVINVIENEGERREVLTNAWSLTERVLIVSARLADESRGNIHQEYEDGVLTKRGTFQRFFDQTELRNWIDSVLDTRSVAAAPGIFYVFTNESAREAFVAAHYRRQTTLPRLRRSELLFEQHKDLLQSLMGYVSDRGRLPEPDELVNAAAIEAIFGSLKRAFSVVRRVTGDEDWEIIREERALDLLVYLALSRFDGRQRFNGLPPELKRDVRAFFGAYTKACTAADELLFAVGEPGNIDAACISSEIGKLTPSSLYVHESAISSLSVLLRIFEGCARGYLGVVEGANLTKMSRLEPKVSYLKYPDFDRDPHPELEDSTTVNLSTFSIRIRHYDRSRNPPILHRKETFVTPTYPLRSKFERLTVQEERYGLFDDPARIGNKLGWLETLDKKGVILRGHRLIRRK